MNRTVVLVDKYEGLIGNLGFDYLESYLKSNRFNVIQLIQGELSIKIEDALKDLIRHNSEIVAVGLCMSHSGSFSFSQKVCKMVKKIRPNIITTGGGHFATLSAEDILRENSFLDNIVCGEGEVTYPELLKYCINGLTLHKIDGLCFRDAGNIIRTSPRQLLADLDSLKFPARNNIHIIRNNGLPILMSMSRGCFAHCSFCSITAFYKQSPGRSRRSRSAKSVVDEIEYIINQFKYNKFEFIDDQFIGISKKDKHIAKEFAEELLKRGLKIEYNILCRPDTVDTELIRILKESGCAKIGMGIESGTNRGLKSLAKSYTVKTSLKALKILKNLNIRYYFGFILMDPFHDAEHLMKNILFLYHSKRYWTGTAKETLTISPYLVIHAGTPVYKTLFETNRLTGDFREYNWKNDDWRINFLKNFIDIIAIFGYRPRLFFRWLIRKFFYISGIRQNSIYRRLAQ